MSGPKCAIEHWAHKTNARVAEFVFSQNFHSDNTKCDFTISFVQFLWFTVSPQKSVLILSCQQESTTKRDRKLRCLILWLIKNLVYVRTWTVSMISYSFRHLANISLLHNGNVEMNKLTEEKDCGSVIHFSSLLTETFIFNRTSWTLVRAHFFVFHRTLQ